MAYDVILSQINTNVYGFGRGGGAMGFPPSANFNAVVYSHWVCGPGSTTNSSYCGIGPAFIPFLVLQPADGTLKLSNKLVTNFFDGTFAPIAAGVRAHILLSVDTQTRTIQLYVNDKTVTVTGTWTGAPGSNWFTFNGGSWDVSGVIASGRYPGVGDIWCANTPSFVDLSVAANRRLFITRDLGPVYLGANGSAPFGFQPPIYSTVQSGGVAIDILTNLGTGGGSFTAYQSPPTLQAPGTCTLPPPPPKLAMDDVNCTTIPELSQNTVFLDWSDDRGHSFGNPVGQPMGDAGEYLTSLQWQRLGMARDRVFRIFWSVPTNTALQGAWIDASPAQS